MPTISLKRKSVGMPDRHRLWRQRLQELKWMHLNHNNRNPYKMCNNVHRHNICLIMLFRNRFLSLSLVRSLTFCLILSAFHVLPLFRYLFLCMMDRLKQTLAYTNLLTSPIILANMRTRARGPSCGHSHSIALAAIWPIVQYCRCILCVFNV